MVWLKNAVLVSAAKEHVIVLFLVNANANAATTSLAHSKANAAKIANAAKLAAKLSALAKLI